MGLFDPGDDTDAMVDQNRVDMTHWKRAIRIAKLPHLQIEVMQIKYKTKELNQNYQQIA
jgi:hypothetical protein